VFRDEDKRLEEARDEGMEPTASQDEKDLVETKSQDDGIGSGDDDCTASNPVTPGSLTTTSDPATMEEVDTNADTDAIAGKREGPCVIENNSYLASDETHNLSPVSGIKFRAHRLYPNQNPFCFFILSCLAPRWSTVKVNRKSRQCQSIV